MVLILSFLSPRRFNNCFSGISVHCTILNAKDVARQMKGHDLPSAVSQQFIASNGPGLDLVKVLDRPLFSKDFGRAHI